MPAARHATVKPLLPADEREVIAEFVSSLPGALERLRLAIDGNDAQSVALAAHGLKGSCWSVGAIRLGERAAAIEAAAKAGELDGATDLLARLMEAVAQLRPALDAALRLDAA